MTEGALKYFEPELFASLRELRGIDAKKSHASVLRNWNVGIFIRLIDLTDCLFVFIWLCIRFIEEMQASKSELMGSFKWWDVKKFRDLFQTLNFMQALLSSFQYTKNSNLIILCLNLDQGLLRNSLILVFLDQSFDCYHIFKAWVVSGDGCDSLKHEQPHLHLVYQVVRIEILVGDSIVLTDRHEWKADRCSKKVIVSAVLKDTMILHKITLCLFCRFDDELLLLQLKDCID